MAVTNTKTKAKEPAKTAPRKRVNKGESMICEVCGLSVVVEQVGDIAVSHEDVLLCCSTPMKQKTVKAKAATK